MPARIVVGVEGSARSEDGLALARLLARLHGGELVLVNAYPHDPTAGGIPNPEYEAYVRGRSAELLAGYGADARTVSVASLSPARALHEVAEREGASLIVVGPTHRAAPGRVATGSVADRLLSGAPCPIAAAPAGYAAAGDPGVARVGVAFVRTDAGHSALRAGAALARAAGAGLEVLAVADPTVVAPDAWARRADLSELVEAQHAVLRQGIDEALEQLGDGVAALARVLEGRPADVLCAESLRLDLLVCGSRAYGPATSVLVGGVSKHVMHHAACPVLVVPRAA
jgi:nucleotide-binding universal stress UspA family protein